VSSDGPLSGTELREARDASQGNAASEAKKRGFPQLALRASKQSEKHNRPGNPEQSEMHTLFRSAKQSELHAVPGSAKQSELHAVLGSAEQSELHAVPGSAEQSELHAVPGSPKRKLRECGLPHVQHLRFPQWRVYGALSGTELWKLAPRAEGMRLRKRKNAASLSSRFGLRSKGISVHTKAHHHSSRFGLRSMGISVRTKAHHHTLRFGLRSMGGFTGRRECPRSKHVPAVLGLSPALCHCRSA